MELDKPLTHSFESNILEALEHTYLQTFTIHFTSMKEGERSLRFVVNALRLNPFP